MLATNRAAGLTGFRPVRSSSRPARLTNGIRQLAATGRLFGSYPFERYLFIVHATSGEGGATEHLNSTVIQRPRWSFAPRKEYLKFVRTAAQKRGTAGRSGKAPRNSLR
jgi:predicted metalloprotease with PDZ domain